MFILYISIGRSSLEIFSVGTPIIMLKPRTSILQLTYGMYVTMGMVMNITCCVAYEEDEYVTMAINLMANQQLLNAYRQLILSRYAYHIFFF